jgi:hypothetical protein
VVELEGAEIPIVAADPAATPGFCDENLLDFAPPLDDTLCATPLAAVIAAGLNDELSLSVTSARHPDRRQAGALCCARDFGASPSRIPRPQPITPHPMPDRPLAQTDLVRDLGNGLPSLDQLLEPTTLDPTRMFSCWSDGKSC